MKAKLPHGKTQAVIIENPRNVTSFEEGDEVYIDGYVRGHDDRPWAVCVRMSDGFMDLIDVRDLKVCQK